MYGTIKRAQSGQIEKKDDSDKVCFWLGFWLWLLGLIIAAIIGKAEGVKRAAKGFIYSFVIFIVVYVLLAMLTGYFYCSSSDNKVKRCRLALDGVAAGVWMWSSDTHRVPRTLDEIAAGTYEHFDKVTEKKKRCHYIDKDDLIDPWGNEVKMKVDSRKIAGSYSVKILLRSAGPDGEYKTDDDIIKEDSLAVYSPVE